MQPKPSRGDVLRVGTDLADRAVLDVDLEAAEGLADAAEGVAGLDAGGSGHAGPLQTGGDPDPGGLRPVYSQKAPGTTTWNFGVSKPASCIACRIVSGGTHCSTVSQ